MFLPRPLLPATQRRRRRPTRREPPISGFTTNRVPELNPGCLSEITPTPVPLSQPLSHSVPHPKSPPPASPLNALTNYLFSDLAIDAITALLRNTTTTITYLTDSDSDIVMQHCPETEPCFFPPTPARTVCARKRSCLGPMGDPTAEWRGGPCLSIDCGSSFLVPAWFGLGWLVPGVAVGCGRVCGSRWLSGWYYCGCLI